jgi:Ala-tRNA(Pro) deacylase
MSAIGYWCRHVMLDTEAQLLEFLDAQQIPYQRFEHPPVYTCEEAERLRPRLPAVSTKNLFLRDRQGTFYLLMTACEKKLDLKRVGNLIGASKLHFASEEMLSELLNLTRGSVTVLGLINETEHRVQLWIDAEIWQQDNFLCHPLVNTATLLLSKSSLERFFELTGHGFNLIDM